MVYCEENQGKPLTKVPEGFCSLVEVRKFLLTLPGTDERNLAV